MHRRSFLRTGLAGALMWAPAVRCLAAAQAATALDRKQALDAMKRATAFMVEKVSTNGGYVWTYLPDLSRRWGEMEARDTMIWTQSPGSTSMGHLFLDAYHATGDDYYYQAAERVAGALIWGQLPSGGWNYIIDFAGERSLREWYDTVGRNGWRLEEFQHYYGNGTYDDSVTQEAGKFLLRLYLEKRDPKFKPALDKTIQFVLDSQYPIGGWPQRFPLKYDVSDRGNRDYTSYLTFNDDVAVENVDFLLMCYQALGDGRLLDPVIRGMNAFLVTQQGPPQAGWGLQHTLDLKPAGARTYEPKALVTHTTGRNIEQLVKFYRLTGETKFIARVPEALDWLDSVKLPPDLATAARTHPTYVEIGTNAPLYVHRRGSNVVNGEYYVDHDPHKTLAHYSAFRRVDTAGLRRLYAQVRAMPLTEATAGSPLLPGSGVVALPRLFAPAPRALAAGESIATRAAAAIAALNATGYWPTKLGTTSHPYRAGAGAPTQGDFSETQVGDQFDTSPFNDDTLVGISTTGYIENMSQLIRYLDE